MGERIARDAAPHSSSDAFGFTWLQVHREPDDPDYVAGLCTDLHAVNTTLESDGFGRTRVDVAVEASRGVAGGETAVDRGVDRGENSLDVVGCHRHAGARLLDDAGRLVALGERDDGLPGREVLDAVMEEHR